MTALLLALIGALITFMAYRHGVKHGASICYDEYVLPLVRALDEVRQRADEGADRGHLVYKCEQALRELRRNVEQGK